MTAPTTHWSTTGRLHTGTVDGCGACEADAALTLYEEATELLEEEFDAAAEARYRAMIGADLPQEVRAERARANREKAREAREGGEPLIDPSNALAEHWRHVAQGLEASVVQARASERRRVLEWSRSVACEVLGLRPENLERMGGMPVADFRLLEHQVLTGCGFHAFYGDDCAICGDGEGGKGRESDSLPPRNDLQAESVSLPLRADDDAGETHDAQEDR